MIMTYDWLFFGRQDGAFLDQINKALESCEPTELSWKGIHRLHFRPEEAYIFVYPYSKTSDFHHKIIPKKISYTAVRKILDGNFAGFEDGETIDIFDDRKGWSD